MTPALIRTASLLVGFLALAAGVADRPRLGWCLMAAAMASTALAEIVRPKSEGPSRVPEGPRGTVTHRALFCLILVVFVGLGIFRFGEAAGVLERPASLSGFGARALMSAHEVRRGELSLSSLVLYREMTQEACGDSLLYVLWHAGFQLLLGGLSIKAAAAAVLAASALSLVLIYRIAAGLLDPIAGLAAMATFAFAPATVSNARSVSPFAFSALLILFACDRCVSFARNPTWWRGLLLGLAVPAVGYGMANIWPMLLALPAFLLARLMTDRTFRSRSPYGFLVAGATTLVLLLPQLLNASQVRASLTGRGEHLLTSYVEGYFPGYSPGEARRHVLKENLAYLTRFTLGKDGERSWLMPGAVPMLLALVTCLLRAHRPERLLLALFFLLSYLGPLIAVMAGPPRCMLLVPGQALLIGCFFADLANDFREGGWGRTGASLTGLLVGALCLYDLSLSTPHLLSDFPEARLRRFIRARPHGSPVFFFMRDEPALPYLRWNPPEIGADSRSRVPLLPMRYADIPVVTALVDSLDVPATIVLHRGEELAPDLPAAAWSPVEATGFTASVRAPRRPGARAWLVACDILPFKRSESVVFSYRASYLGIVRLDQGSLTWPVHVPSQLDAAAILVTFLDVHGLPVDLEVELEGLPPGTLAAEGSATGLLGLGAVELSGTVTAGEHRLRVSARPGGATVFVEAVTLLGRIHSSG